MTKLRHQWVQSVRSTLVFIAGIVLVISTCWNLWWFGVGVERLPPRIEDPIVVLENQFLPLKYALIEENYRGRIGYETVRSFRGEPRRPTDDVRWAELRYVTIPFILVRDMPDTPYVIGDFTDEHSIPDTPAGLTKVYDHGDGLVLYKRMPMQ
jgi:hypothetical protein